MTYLQKTWNAEDRDAVRAAHREIWPDVRADLRAGLDRTERLTEHPQFRESLRLMALHDGYGASDIAVTFGVSRERARQWLVDVLSPEEMEAHGDTQYRVWHEEEERFAPVSDNRAATLARKAQSVARATAERQATEKARQQDVTALHNLLDSKGEVPSAVEFMEYVGEIYQTIARRWKEKGDTYARAWDRFYGAAGLDRPDARTKRNT